MFLIYKHVFTLAYLNECMFAVHLYYHFFLFAFSSGFQDACACVHKDMSVFLSFVCACIYSAISSNMACCFGLAVMCSVNYTVCRGYACLHCLKKAYYF